MRWRVSERLRARHRPGDEHPDLLRAARGRDHRLERWWVPETFPRAARDLEALDLSTPARRLRQRPAARRRGVLRVRLATRPRAGGRARAALARLRASCVASGGARLPVRRRSRSSATGPARRGDRRATTRALRRGRAPRRCDAAGADRACSARASTAARRRRPRARRAARGARADRRGCRSPGFPYASASSPRRCSSAASRPRPQARARGGRAAGRAAGERAPLLLPVRARPTRIESGAVRARRGRADGARRAHAGRRAVRQPARLPVAALRRRRPARSSGRDDEARALADEKLELARRWGAPSRARRVAARRAACSRAAPRARRMLRRRSTMLDGTRRRGSSTRARWSTWARRYRRDNHRSEGARGAARGVDLAHRAGAPAWSSAATRSSPRPARARAELVVSGLDALTAERAPRRRAGRRTTTPTRRSRRRSSSR